MTLPLEPICYNPIGIIRSPFKSSAGMPIQTVAARGVAGSIELDPLYETGLQDLPGFSHLILLYHLHLISPQISLKQRLVVMPFLDQQPHGVFATRSPRRPNALGFSIVRLTGMADNILSIEGIDVVDGTPLLDIKPYIPTFDVRGKSGSDEAATEQVRVGWFADKLDRLEQTQADNRFE